MTTTPDAVEARPWAPADGPQPTVRVYLPDARPGLWVRAAGEWRYGMVTGRQDHPDGRVVYQVDVQLPDERDGIIGSRSRLYEWPQPGLKAAHRG